MDKDSNFETFLIVNPQYFLIAVINKKEKNKIYEKKEIIQNKSNKLNLILLDEFLKQNVFEIEKKINKFLNNIFLILDNKIFFPVQISIKKNLSGKTISTETLNYLLNEIKKDCYKTFLEKKIIHIILDKYLIDEISYSKLPSNVTCDFLSLDVSFFCLSNKEIKNFEEILKKYHILVTRILSADYVRSLFGQKNYDLITMSKLVKDGYNKNEVEILERKRQKTGLFERFFHLFR